MAGHLPMEGSVATVGETEITDRAGPPVKIVLKRGGRSRIAQTVTALLANGPRAAELRTVDPKTADVARVQEEAREAVSGTGPKCFAEPATSHSLC